MLPLSLCVIFFFLSLVHGFSVNSMEIGISIINSTDIRIFTQISSLNVADGFSVKNKIQRLLQMRCFYHYSNKTNDGNKYIYFWLRVNILLLFFFILFFTNNCPLLLNIEQQFENESKNYVAKKCEFSTKDILTVLSIIAGRCD